MSVNNDFINDIKNIKNTSELKEKISKKLFQKDKEIFFLKNRNKELNKKYKSLKNMFIKIINSYSEKLDKDESEILKIKNSRLDRREIFHLKNEIKYLEENIINLKQENIYMQDKYNIVCDSYNKNIDFLKKSVINKSIVIYEDTSNEKNFIDSLYDFYHEFNEIYYNDDFGDLQKYTKLINCYLKYYIHIKDYVPRDRISYINKLTTKKIDDESQFYDLMIEFYDTIYFVFKDYLPL